MGFIVDMGADEFFMPMVVVAKPAGGEVWASGSVHTITWVTDLYYGAVDILFSEDGGTGWQTIGSSPTDTGRYVWELPGDVDSNQCVISVVPSVPDPNVVIIDSGLFTIQRYPSRPPAPPGQMRKWDNFRRTGLSENYGPEIGCVKWQFEVEGAVSASVSVGPNSTVYVPCEDGNLYALDANGVLLWSYDTNSPLISSPAVGYYGMIYVGGENGKLYAIDGKGKLRWTHTTDGFVYSSAAVSAEGNVYACSQDGKLYALGPDGSELWTFEIAGPGAVGSPIFASPSIGPDGTVYIAGLYDPNLYALDPNDGSVKWACSFERLVSYGRRRTWIVFGWPFASPVVAADGTIYQTLLYDPNLYAVEPNTGSIMWSVELADVATGDVDGWSQPAIGPDGTIYVSLNDPCLRAVDPNGNIKWVTHLGMGDGFTLTVGSDGRIYAAGTDGYLCVLETYRRWNREIPREIARFKTDSEIVFPVVPANDRIIFSDANNRIWAIGGEGCEDEVLSLHRPEDVDGSRATNFIDFALFAVDWLACNDPLASCSAAYWDETYFTGDIDRNLYVDFADLKVLADQWLTEY
jgi:outer membrane protein assembly factor BamB